MNISIAGWGGLIFFLWFSTFGLLWTIVALLSLFCFLIGGVSYIYITNSTSNLNIYQQTTESNQGLPILIDFLINQRQGLRCDKRITGAHVIDERLHEIIRFLIRDYVYPWYDTVSADEEFVAQIQVTGQNALVKIAARMKEVDWIPYITTKLVDDAASHLRLYRQACVKVKMKQDELKILENKQKQIQLLDVNKPQSLAHFKTTTQQNEIKTHSRNNSTSNIQIQKSPTHSRNNSIAKNDVKKEPKKFNEMEEIEKIFFDLETNMENDLKCRDLVSTDKDETLRFLQEVVLIIMFLVSESDDFHCELFDFFIRDLILGGVVLPLINILTDPDYINITIIWLCRDVPISSEMFLTVLRVTDHVDELLATRDLVNSEISYLRSKDSGGDNDALIKQELNSLFYVCKLVDNKLNRLQQGLDSDSTGLMSEYLTQQDTLQLTLDEILKNNIALSYFIDYVSSIGQQHYLFFYLNIEGWKVTVQRTCLDNNDFPFSTKNKDQNIKPNFSSSTIRSSVNSPAELMREEAMRLYDQYLSEKSSLYVALNTEVVEDFKVQLFKSQLSDSWFDNIQNALIEKIKTDEKLLAGFHKSWNYVKLLSELELLKDTLAEEFDEDIQSLDNVSLSDNLSIDSFDVHEATEESGSPSQNSRCGSNEPNEPVLLRAAGNFRLAAEIIEAGVVQDRGKTYGIYALIVTKTYENGFIHKWHVYRRYSDFFDLQQRIKDTFKDLGKLPFPGKKTFDNMERSTLNKRMRMLNDWLQILFAMVERYPRLEDILSGFLEEGEYDKSGGVFAKTFESLVTPIKSSIRSVGQAVRTMPDNLLNTVDEVFDGISKVFQNRNKHFEDPMRVSAGINDEHFKTDDNIPLRIMLLLMDEVFDLKSRNQWLRRRIVILLRQIIRTMFGDIVNKKIVAYVADLTNAEQVADYLTAFKNSMWPNGAKPVPSATRDDNTRMRTRVMAKTLMLSSLSDELKHVIGSDTTRRGLLRVFNLLQHNVLNRRLLFVLAEGVLETLFQEHELPKIFETVYSRSNRVREKNKLKSAKGDLKR